MAAIPCLFCGRASDSKEHYIPQWLSKASGRQGETILKGAAKDGVLQSAKEHGTATEAFEKNLCQHCNNTLGNLLENPVSALLKPLMAGDFSAAGSFTNDRRQLIAWWALLHALEHDFLENRLDKGPKDQLLALFGQLIAGNNPALPVDARVHFAKAGYSEFAFFLTKQLIDCNRGSVQAIGSFWWGMQAGHLILSVARMPNGARPAKGGGLSLWPVECGEVPTYEDIRYYHAASNIDTSLPARSTA